MIRNSIAFKHYLLILITIILIFGGCSQYVNYTPDPDKDVNQWITNFANQRSFNYHYIMKTMSIYTEAHGECLIGIGEHVSGMWQGNGQKLDFEYYGLYDLEYEKQNGHWIENVRGEQTEILTQIERVLEFDEFEYQPDAETYTYRFKANVAFLSPIHRKEMVGSIRFSGKDYRPVEIWAGLPDSSVYWMVKLSDYNRLRSIKPPVMKWQEHTINTGENYGSLKKRFNLLDIPYSIKRGNQKVEINVPGYINADELQRYFDKVEMTVSRVVDDRADAKRILEINGKKSIIYVGDRIFGSSDIKDGQVKFDAIGRPFMALSLRKPQDISRRLLVEINDETPQIVNIDNPGKMSKIKLYFDKTFHDMHVLRAQLLQPLYNIDFDL